MTKFLIGGLIAAALAAPVPAFAQPAAAPDGTAQTVKSRADIQSHVQQRFARMDANRDGFVTRAEADALQARRGERRQKHAGQVGKGAGHRDPARMFARLDANSDGSITRAEADAARTARAQRTAAKGKPVTANAVAFGGLFERADSNRDGTISRAEFTAAPPRAGKRHAAIDQGRRKGGMAGRMFDRGDANKDGRVSLAEAEAQAVSRFDSADLNRDGQVTPQERSQARQQRRTQRKPS